jgi:hypothetical protein
MQPNPITGLLPQQYRAIPPETRFSMQTEKSLGCWHWIGCLNPKGYGVIFIEGRPRLAHRFSWERANGPIAPGLCVLHHCDNRRCVRPDHLFLGTRGDNIKDCVAKGRTALGDKNGSRIYPERLSRGQSQWKARLTDEAVVAIRRSHAAGERPLSKLAKHYGVSTHCIFCVVHRRTWKHIA